MPAPRPHLCRKCEHRYEGKFCPACGAVAPTPEQAKLPPERAMTISRMRPSLIRRFRTACFVRKTSMKNEISKFMDKFAREAGY